MSKKIKKYLIIIFSIIIVGQIFLFAPKSCHAITSIIDPKAFNCTKYSPSDVAGKTDSECSLDDFMRIGINISEFILGLTGSLALGAFIYGGIVMLISGGSSEKVTQAKSIIIGAVIGLIIVFASYIIIAFVYKALGLNFTGTTEFPKPI